MTGSEQEIQVDTLAAFERYARAAGAQVSVVSGEEAAATATAIAGGVEGRVICTSAVKEIYPGVCEALESAGWQVTVAEDMAEIDATPSELAVTLAGGTGIVLGRAGVAETGSVVLADDALTPRLLSMLADVCVVLLPASAIVPGLDEAGVLLAELERAGHRYVSLVTGPSRTADIERVLTIGVQGPKVLHIIVL